MVFIKCCFEVVASDGWSLALYGGKILSGRIICLQGTVLSAFFWGYTMTQVLGGYLSDRIGGDIVITTAAVGWSVLTFWTPFLVYVYTDKNSVLMMVVATRVLLGAMQGKHHNVNQALCQFGTVGKYYSGFACIAESLDILIPNIGCLVG